MSYPPRTFCPTPLGHFVLPPRTFCVLRNVCSQCADFDTAAAEGGATSGAGGSPLGGSRDATAPTDAPPQLRALPLSAPKIKNGELSRALRVHFTLDSSSFLIIIGGRGAGGADAAGAESPGAGARPQIIAGACGGG